MTTSPRSGRRRGRSVTSVSPLALVGWIGPASLLIGGVVVWPLFETFRAAFESFSITGRPKGFVGFANFAALLRQPALPTVLVNALVWVVAGVALTTAIGLLLAQLLAQRFPTRSWLEAALIVPWAASIVMTATVFRWVLNYYYGIVNPLLESLHVISAPVDWLANPVTLRLALITVVTFVSLPFTTFAILAGLRAVPRDIYEAAAVDGSSALQTYRHITWPLIAGPVAITVVLNALWIFNSFPIIYVLTRTNPGYGADTTITFMYKIAFLTDLDLGQGAAMAVVNVVIAAVGVGFFLRLTRAER